MGLLDKVKNLFTEEVEEERPIKKEIKHIEIPTPKREIPVEPVRHSEVVEEPKERIVETPVLTREKEDSYKFPVYFDDADFADLPKAVEKEKPVVKREIPAKPKLEPYQGAKMEEVKHKFKPSPIISPVYGVLDKNYSKEDITPKKTISSVPARHTSEKLTLDDVRNRAFGTLEDDLEKTLFGQVPIIEDTYNDENELDIFEELETTEKTRSSRSGNDLLREDLYVEKPAVDLTEELEKQKQKIDEINEYIKNNTAVKQEKDIFEELEASKKVKEVEPDIFEEIKSDIKEDPIVEPELVADEVEEIKEEIQEPIEEEVFEEKEDDFIEEPTSETEEAVESDLFNLIDSMYEKREEE